MMTEETKKILYRTLLTIGLVLLFSAFICVLITDWSDALPKNDLYFTTMLLGWGICWIGNYFQPISAKELENGPGCFLTLNILLFYLLPMGWIHNIEHFTTPVVIMLAICAVLYIVNSFLFYKKYQQFKALSSEDEDEKKPE